MRARAVSATSILASVSIGAGMVFLASFFFLEVEADRKANAAIRELEQFRLIASAHADEPPSPEQPIDIDASSVDQSLWSAARIQEYRAALQQTTLSAEGILSIDALKIRVPVFAGTGDEALDIGAGRIEGTPALGADGNVGVAAHRDGHFRALKDIEIGAEIVVETADATYRYEVFATSIVDPADVHVLAPTSKPQLTLVTCYPFYFVGSAPQRFIVHARGIESESRSL